MESVAFNLNSGFIARMTRGLPYVRCKIAASLDGRTALNNHQSQWITGEAARADVQHWRAQSCAIITGIGTVLADNPCMNVRLANVSRQPLRVIVDSQLQTPLDCNLLSTSHPQAAPVLIAYANDANQQQQLLMAKGVRLLQLPNQNSNVDLTALLATLAQQGVNEVLLEAGQGLNGAFLQAGLIDELILYYAPKLMGTDAKGMFAVPELTNMQQVTHLQIIDVRQFGQDIRLRAKPKK